MAHMAQIILSKPLFIIVWMYQKMMRWLSRLLNQRKLEIIQPSMAHMALIILLKTLVHHYLDVSIEMMR
jgi:hypothetical protein